MPEDEENQTTENTPDPNKPPEPKLLTEDEVNKRIEAARKQEKDKLYGRIEELTGAVSQLSTEAKNRKEAEEAAEKARKEQEEKERTAQLSSEDRLAEQLKQFEERLAQEATQRARLEQQLADEKQLADLAAYRESILRGQTEIIPDLVGGDSREAIDNSVARAKSRFQELFVASTSNAEGANPNNVTGNMPRPTNPTNAALDEAELQKSLQNFQIDPVRYTKDHKYKLEMDAKRQEMLERVGSAYQRSVGR